MAMGKKGMTIKQVIKAYLVAGMFFFALGGWLLHYRIHPPEKNPSFYIPYIAGVVGVFIVPTLFWFKRTFTWAYIINGFGVIIGTITMAQFSVEHFKGELVPINIIVNTLLADILILWGVFVAGKALFDLEFFKNDSDPAPRGRYLRYPNMGWWYVHLAGFTLVYGAGKLLWK